jgi:hypothetical protein
MSAAPSARGARVAALLWALTAWAFLAGAVVAQPYAADGGFDRPRVAFPLTRASLAATIDEGRPRLLIGDANGLRLVDLQPGRPLAAPSTTWLDREAVVRGVAAADGWQGGPAAYAWFVRDTSSGAYRYTWRWGDEEMPLAEAPQALDFAVVVGSAGPEAWLAQPTAAGGRLERYRWGDAGTETMVTSTRSLAAPTLGRDDAGALHLAYLEGATVETPIGLSAEWAVVYRGPDGSERRFDDALGPPARLALDAEAPVVLLWERSDAALIAVTPNGEAAPQTLGFGRAVGVAADRAYWASGASIVATPLEARGSTADGPHNVAWSPYAVDRTALTRVDGVTFLGWAGTLPGGAGVALTSDDAAPMRPTWRDHVAAWFGWTPWAIGEEALGQLTGALLIGVLGTMVLFPLFWLLSLPLARSVPDRWTRPAGALVATTTLLVIAAAAVTRAAGLGHDPTDLIGGYWGFGVALAAGVVVAPALLARADLEKQPALLASAGLAGFVSLSLASFIAFQPWLQLFGL